MNKAGEFDNILDECLERVIRGDSIEACLESYPEHAVALKPLLRTALDTREAVAILPRAEFRDRAGREFQEAIRQTAPAAGRGFFSRFPRWATALSIVVMVLLGGTGIVAASGNSLPDNPLYAVKLATESVRLAAATRTVDKTELYVELTDERIEEIIAMAEKGKTEQVERVTERLNDQLMAMAELAMVWVAPVEESGADVFKATAPMESAPAPSIAPTPSPAPEPAPSSVPEPEPSPAPENEQMTGPDLPPSVLEMPPRETTGSEVMIMVAAPLTAAGEAAVSSDVPYADGLGDIDRLEAAILLSSLDNSRVLREALETVPETVRAAVQNAIDVADAGYRQVLDTLE